MAEYKFYLKQPIASEFVENLLTVVNEVSPNAHISLFSITTNSGGANFLGKSAAMVASTLKERPEFKNPHQFLVERPYLDLVRANLQTNDGYNFAIGTEPGRGFYLSLSTSGARESEYQFIAPVTDALRKHFNLLRQEQVLEAAIPERERTALQTAQTILLDFASEAARLSQMSAANTERMNEVIITKTGELEALYANKHKELEALQQTKTNQLHEREEVFRLEKAHFDVRENTVVRRDLLTKIERVLGDQKTVKITEGTTRKRLPIHVLCSVTLLAALILAAVFGHAILTDTSANWHNFIPLSAGTVIFISTGIFYLRWTDQWFKEHANAEFENRKFYLDVVRASWIAELLFEWKEKKEVPFPEQLIARYATGLFEPSNMVRSTMHPIDDLKGILANISEVKFSKKGEMSLKKKAEPAD